MFYDVPKEQKKIAHSLWEYFRFRIAYKLLAIYRSFTIKKIHLLHVLQIMPEKPSASGMAAFFCNIDAGFDGKELRSAMFSHSIIPNVCPNPRNGGEAKEDWLYDEEMENRADERLDGFKAVLNRFDISVSSWNGWDFLAFIVIFLKNFHKSN